MPALVIPSPPAGGEGWVRGVSTRRAFLSAVTLGGLTAPLSAAAQQAVKVWRIGLRTR